MASAQLMGWGLPHDCPSDCKIFVAQEYFFRIWFISSVYLLIYSLYRPLSFLDIYFSCVSLVYVFWGHLVSFENSICTSWSLSAYFSGYSSMGDDPWGRGRSPSVNWDGSSHICGFKSLACYIWARLLKSHLSVDTFDLLMLVFKFLRTLTESSCPPGPGPLSLWPTPVHMEKKNQIPNISAVK